MPRLGRRERSCEGKLRYETKQQALNELYRLARTTGTYIRSMHAYRCRFCRGWHLGHYMRH
jgi:hypothetical protein